MTRRTFAVAALAGAILGLLSSVYTLTPSPYYHSPVWFMYAFEKK
jgi:hypothetical protein